MNEKISYLYSYSLTHLTKTNRVKCVYVLKGRKGGIGMVKSLGGFFVCNGCFIIPEKNNQEIKEVLDRWNIRHNSKRIKLIN